MHSNFFKTKLVKGKKVTILALNWRDLRNPLSGGAEVHAHEMFSRNAQKYQIIHLAPEFKNCINDEIIDGVRYIRKGTTMTVLFYAMYYYLKNRKVIDIVIDQCNAHRFFTCFYVPRRKRIFYTHQLYRELWYIMAKPPISQIGYLLETPMLKLNRKDKTITVSESTKKGLLDVGFSEKNITIVPNGINFKPLPYNELYSKDSDTCFVYAGRYANSKGINLAVEAIGKLKQNGKQIKLKLIGRENENYIDNVLKPICKKYHLTIGKEELNDIIICGFVSEEEKHRILGKSKALVLPSTREGWGIVIIEAAVMGTPSIVFNSPGCVDAVDFGNAGYLCSENTVDALVENMIRVIEDDIEYEQKRKSAYNFSVKFNWKDSAKIFSNLIDSITK